MTKYKTSFLEKLYEHKVRRVHSKVTLLNQDEKVYGEVDGVVMDGSLNVDGNSAVRRNVTLTLSIKDRDDKKVFTYIDLSKKVKVQIGLENYTDEHTDEEIIWFNMGTYLLLDPSYNHDTNTMTMSLQGQDKMALMNGTLGGLFPTTTTFLDKNDVTGEKTSRSWRQIFQDTATVFGGEDPGRVVVDEVPDYIYDYVQVKTVKGLYENFIHVDADSSEEGNRIISHAWDGDSAERDIKFSQGERLYRIRRFGPDDPVVSDSSTNEVYMKTAGDNFTSVFDDVVEQLGNTHEYFYDREGNLILQKVQNFINDSFDPIKRPDLDYLSYELNMENYMPDYTGFPFAYDFSNKEGVVSYTNNPAWTNVKNHFVVVGKDGGTTLEIAIDKKPTIEETREWFKLVQEEFQYDISSPDLEFLHLDGNYDRPIYNEDTDSVPWLFKEAANGADPVYVDVPLNRVPWQIAHGLRNYIARNVGELSNERVLPRWGRECESMIFKYTLDVQRELLLPNTGIFNPENIPIGDVWLTGYPVEDAASDVDEVEQLNYLDPQFSFTGDSAFWMYFIDIIDENSALGKYSISKIGKRTVVENSDKATTIFRTNPRNLVVITEEELEKLGGNSILEDLKGRNQPYAVIKNTTSKTIKRPELDAIETKNEFPWNAITGNIDTGQQQQLTVTGSGVFTIGGGAQDGLGFVINKGSTAFDDSDSSDIDGVVAISVGRFVHPVTKQSFKNELANSFSFYNTIVTPFIDPSNSDTLAFIAYIKNKNTRMPDSTSTDNLFAVIKFEGTQAYYAAAGEEDEYPKWEPFTYDKNRDGDIIVATITQEGEVSEDGADFSHRIDTIDDLFNIEEQPFTAMFSSDGAIDCFSLLRNLMYQYTNFSEVVTINCLPIYHLEPNTLVRIEDEFSDIHGVFLITSYSLPMGTSAQTMSINAVKVNQRI